MAATCPHVFDKDEHMVRCYAYYSNVSGGNRKKQNQSAQIRSVLESDVASIDRWKNWVRLIWNVFEAYPLTCPR